MEFIPREQVMSELQQSLQTYIQQFDIDAIGIFEEQGEGDHYYLGYTVTKGEKTYHIHLPYVKNNEGGLSPAKNEWTIESDDPQVQDERGYSNIEEVFNHL